MKKRSSIYRNPLSDWEVVKGSNRLDQTLLSRADFLLRLRKGSSAAYPELGSEFHLLTKQTRNLGSKLIKCAEAALQPMVEDKSVTRITCVVLTTVGSAWTLAITLHAGGTSYTFDHTVFIGTRG